MRVKSDTLFQNATDVITKCDSYLTAKCGKSLLQNVQAFYYKMRQFYNKMQELLQNETILLQNRTVITKCDNLITKCDNY